MSLVGTLDADIQNPVHLYTLFMFTLSEPEKVGFASKTRSWPVSAQAMSVPATFYKYRHTATLNCQSASSVDAVVLTNIHFVPVKLLLRTNQALEQLHRIFSY